jgi:LysR family transcriptional regulator for bpeEF and oprC
MDQLFCIRVFVRVVELGSFARASEALDIARPRATHAVAALEKRLGVRLLNRTTRQLSLTEDGRVYYNGCLRMLSELAEAEDQLSSSQSSPRGRLCVSVPTSLIHTVFLSSLPKFLARYPELQVEFVVTDRPVNLVQEGIDCAVRGSELPDDSTLVARHVLRTRFLTCASPEYFAARGTPLTIAALADHECVRFISPSTGRVWDWQFKRGEAEESYTPRGRLGVTSLEAAGAAASYGIGIAQVPEVVVVPLLQSGRLKPVLLEWAAPAPPLKVVYPSNRYLTAKVRVFANFVAETYLASANP